MPLLEIKDLTVDFETAGSRVRAADGVSLSVDVGETLCLAGESGSGKSVTALSVARLLPTPPARYVAGEIRLAGAEVLRLKETELSKLRGSVAGYVFQEPSASLNPVMRIGAQIREALKRHRPDKAGEAEAVRLLSMVGIPCPEERLQDYPFQLSGGMQQRVMLAIALAAEPKLLIADEPTTALDVTIQAQILELLRELQRKLGMALLLITHNLGIAGELGGRVAVMYAGQVVEVAPAGELLARPLHPYTKALMASAPRLNERVKRLTPIPGSVAALANALPGCRFAPRCPISRPECTRSVPTLQAVDNGRWVRCAYWNS